jgi:hypothetical protein
MSRATFPRESTAANGTRRSLPMASEMPARVEPVDGAVVVDFPWEAATGAVAELDAASATLDSQLGTRADMVGTLEDWVGTYRNEFEDADGRMTSTAGGLREAIVALASSIVTGAETANQQQRASNWQAENPDPQPVGAGPDRPV